VLCAAATAGVSTRVVPAQLQPASYVTRCPLQPAAVFRTVACERRVLHALTQRAPSMHVLPPSLAKLPAGIRTQQPVSTVACECSSRRRQQQHVGQRDACGARQSRPEHEAAGARTCATHARTHAPGTPPCASASSAASSSSLQRSDSCFARAPYSTPSAVTTRGSGCGPRAGGVHSGSSSTRAGSV
jgi:hypothetical protein